WPTEVADDIAHCTPGREVEFQIRCSMGLGRGELWFRDLVGTPADDQRALTCLRSTVVCGIEYCGACVKAEAPRASSNLVEFLRAVEFAYIFHHKNLRVTTLDHIEVRFPECPSIVASSPF